MQTILKNIVSTTCALMILAGLATPALGENQSGDALTIVTINVWFGLDGHGMLRMGEYESKEQREKRYLALVAELREIQPDIVFVQEANPLPHYSRRLARDTEMDEIHAVNNGGIRVGRIGIPSNLRMGIAILAKPDLRLERVGVHRTSGAGIVSNFLCAHLSETRVVLAGVVRPHSQPLYLFCIHAHSSTPDTVEYRNRLREIMQAQEIDPDRYAHHERRFAESSSMTRQDITYSIPYVQKIAGDKPFVVAGDFNAFRPLFPSMTEFAVRLEAIDSFAAANPGASGYTWDTARNPHTRFDGSPQWVNGDAKDPIELLQSEYDGSASHRVDYIFLSSHFARENIFRSELVFTKPRDGIYISDHFGVMTEVSLPAPLESLP
ncbi:MAG: hypothetical protein Kow0099_36230 [Candidatus Abyssubacteria bacterium]